MLTILSAFALIFLFTACSQSGSSDTKNTTYEGANAKIAFKEIVPTEAPGGDEAIRYVFDITNKTKKGHTVDELLREVIETVKQGDVPLSHVYRTTIDNKVEPSPMVNANQTITAEIEYKVKDDKATIDMTFKNGDHFKLKLNEVKDKLAKEESEKREREYAEDRKATERSFKAATEALPRIKTAPGKFDWTWEQYNNLKDDFNLKGDKLEDILKEHPTPFAKKIDDVALVLTYRNAKKQDSSVILIFEADSKGALRLWGKEQSGLE